ncbi:MAG TPA: response regulator transcription factor, partial [Cyclobacteriaceae bacterium]|nr:response regulator transcription factor [Cyclobacteriaceae bacterium]
MSEKRRILIIDDDPDLRKSFELIINGHERFCVVGAFESFEDALKSLGRLDPEIVLMDIELPGMSGIEGVRMLREKYPDVQTVMVTVYEDDEMVFEALKAGAIGYITKDANYLELVEALKEILRGGSPMSSRIARMIVNNYHVNLNSPLTSRERQILHMLSV